MVALDAAAIRIGGNASDKTEAIRQVGSILVDCGNIEPGYVDSMLARERVANTFLGNGIAIPHGIPKDRGLIRQTGVAVLQIPSGVEWNPGEKVHLVVGIATKSDEHLEILSNLCSFAPCSLPGDDDGEGVCSVGRGGGSRIGGKALDALSGGATCSSSTSSARSPTPLSISSRAGRSNRSWSADRQPRPARRGARRLLG